MAEHKKTAKAKEERPKAEKDEKKPAAKPADAEKQATAAVATQEAPKKAKKPVEAKKRKPHPLGRKIFRSTRMQLRRRRSSKPKAQKIFTAASPTFTPLSITRSSP